MRYAPFTSTVLLLAVALAPAIAAAQPRTGPAAPPAAPPPATQPKGPPAAAPPSQATPQQPSPPRPYKPVAFQLPSAPKDPTLEAFRKEVAGIAQRKDRAGLARVVVARGFFWERADGKPADAKKSSVDNLVAALGLDAQDGSGWEALAQLLGEPNAAPDQSRKGVVCAPASPNINEKEFEALTKQTQTDPTEWGYPTTAGVEVRQQPQANAPVVERLGLNLVRVLQDDSPANAVSQDWVKVVTPSGKVGYAPNNAINTLVSDQICYIKEGAAWKIAGVIGGGDQQ